MLISFLLTLVFLCRGLRRQSSRQQKQAPAEELFGPGCDAQTSECSLEVAPKDALGRFYVQPGGDTACLDGSRYNFQVRRGNPKKLHIHFQGGGACGDARSYMLGMCSVYAKHEHQGVFDYTEPANIFHDYSVLVVNYCSGDSHSDDQDVQWGWRSHKIRGYRNAQAALSYARKNFKDLDTLTVSGTSAGSIGLHLWAGRVLRDFKDAAKDRSVLLDGWLSLDTHPSQEMQYITHVCNHDILAPEDKAECDEGRFLLSNQFDRTIAAHPDVRFAAINGVVDMLQVSVFGTGAQEYQKYEMLLLQKWLRRPNFSVYLVQTDQHVFFIRPTFAVATPDSVDGSGTAGPPLAEWVASLVQSPSPMEPRIVCTGEHRQVFPDTNVTGWPTDYCAL